MSGEDTPLKQLGPGYECMCLFETANTRWHVSVPNGVKREDLLIPGFWAHHAKRVSPGDEIRALAEDGTWRATYLVVDKSLTWLKVRELTFNPFSVEEVDDTDLASFLAAHKVVHRGPRKWSVVREDDGAVLTEDIAEKHEASAWLDRHARSQVGAKAA